MIGDLKWRICHNLVIPIFKSALIASLFVNSSMRCYLYAKSWLPLHNRKQFSKTEPRAEIILSHRLAVGEKAPSWRSMLPSFSFPHSSSPRADCFSEQQCREGCCVSTGLATAGLHLHGLPIQVWWDNTLLCWGKISQYKVWSEEGRECVCCSSQALLSSTYFIRLALCPN